MRALLLTLAACSHLPSGPPPTQLAPRGFCPSIARGSLAYASAAATTLYRSVGARPEATGEVSVWLAAQPCVQHVEANRCTDGLAIQIDRAGILFITFDATRAQLAHGFDCHGPPPPAQA